MARRWRSIIALALITSTLASHYSAMASETVTYKYDALGRLVQVSRAGTVNNGITAAYTYDKADNRTNVNVAGAPALPDFTINDVSVTEGGSLVLTVTKTGSTSSTISVNFATANGTAAAGSDYTANSGTLIFAAADTTKSITILTADDAAVESAETVLVNLSGATGGATVSDSQGTGTINDNDAAPTCGGVSFTIGSNGAVTEGASSVFTVTKAGSTSSSCSVNYATANGTAAAGSDYTAASGTLTFTSAQASMTVSVGSTDDAAVESAETFSMSLSSPSGGSAIGTPGSATATLNDNDGAGSCSGVSFSVSDTAGDEGTTFGFIITKAGSTTVSCSVNYATANGTAVAPGDYQAQSGTFTFAPAETTKAVNITPPMTGPGEGTETMYLNLSSPTGGATITDSQGQGTIYNYFDDGGGGCPLC